MHINAHTDFPDKSNFKKLASLAAGQYVSVLKV